MLEHQKKILTNVSNDYSLFRKELEKSLGWLKDNEILDLYLWVKHKYGTTHYHIIKQVFAMVAA